MTAPIVGRFGGQAHQHQADNRQVVQRFSVQNLCSVLRRRDVPRSEGFGMKSGQFADVKELFRFLSS
jgi:hypothetical protein